MDNQFCEIFKIQHVSEELWFGHGLWLCAHSDLDLRDTHPWVMDNNCAQYHEIGQWSKKLWPWHDANRWTDRQIYPKTWFAGGIINHNGSIPRNACVAWLPRKCDYHQTDRQTDKLTDGQTDTGQSDPYVRLCFAGDTTKWNATAFPHTQTLPITLTFDLCPTKSIGFIL